MNFLLLFALVALQVLDAITTLMVLDAGGRELNPLLRKAFAQWGAERVLLVVKAIVVTALLLYGMALPWWLLLAATVFYAAVVARNVHVIKSLKEPESWV